MVKVLVLTMIVVVITMDIVEKVDLVDYLKLGKHFLL